MKNKPTADGYLILIRTANILLASPDPDSQELGHKYLLLAELYYNKLSVRDREIVRDMPTN